MPGVGQWNTVLDQTPQVNSSHVCFALDSELTYVDALADFFLHNEVQRGLKQMFSDELLGIPD